MSDRKLCIYVCLFMTLVVVGGTLVGTHWPQVRDFAVRTYELVRYGESQWVSPTTGMRFVRISSGTFTMGDDQDDAPRHAQRIDSTFSMGEAEVTVGQYLKFLNDGNQQHLWEPGHKEFIKKTGDVFVLTDPKWANYPITYVTWADAMAFCAWLSKKDGVSIRLPTEAEWEYACRAGTTTAYAFGDTLTHDQANFEGKGGKDIWDGLAPVKQFPPNAWRLYDMHGNVWEWCSSQDAAYPYRKDDGREDPKKPALRMLRGGSWYLTFANLRSAFRGRNGPDARDYYVHFGFRCACVVRGEDP